MPRERSPGDVDLDLSGFGVALRGLDAELEARFRQDWSRFLDPAPIAEPLLVVRVRVGGDPAPAGPLTAKSMSARFAADRVRYAMAEGAIDVRGARGRARLAPADADKRFFALVNLVAAALAWRLPARGAALVHAAAAVIDGRAFVLVGPEGSGKTTWARLAKQAGAVLLSDDLALVDASAPRASVGALPLRADKPVPQGPGRWPLAAWLFPGRGTRPRLDPVPALERSARLAANLPFVAERLEADPAIGRVIEALVGGAPGYRLLFAPDVRFMDCLRGLRS